MAAGEMDGGGMAGEELDGEIISPWERWAAGARNVLSLPYSFSVTFQDIKYGRFQCKSQLGLESCWDR